MDADSPNSKFFQINFNFHYFYRGPKKVKYGRQKLNISIQNQSRKNLSKRLEQGKNLPKLRKMNKPRIK